MKIFLLLTLIHVTHGFKLSDFADLPQELVDLYNYTDVDDIGMVETVIDAITDVANVIDEKVEDMQNEEKSNQDEINFNNDKDDAENSIETVVNNKVEQVQDEKTPNQDVEAENVTNEWESLIEDESSEEVEGKNNEEKPNQMEINSNEDKDDVENSVEIINVVKQNVSDVVDNKVKQVQDAEIPNQDGEEEDVNSELVIQDESYEEEEEILIYEDPDACPMDGEDIFQLKLYWEKGTEWQGSKKEKAWCAECKDDCDSGDQVHIRECDDKKKDQFWIFQECSVRPVTNSDVCMTAGADKKKKGNEGKIELKSCGKKREKEQKFRLFDPEDIFEKFQFKLLGEESNNDKICLSQWHHPTKGEELKFFSCKKAFMNDGGTKKKDDTSHWVVGSFDGHL